MESIEEFRKQAAAAPIVGPDAPAELADKKEPGPIDRMAEALANDPALADSIALNVGDHRIWIRGVLPWTGRYEQRPMDDVDRSHITARLQTRWGLRTADNTVTHALNLHAERNSFDPLVDLLDGLPQWDGTPRCGTLLHAYLGAEQGDYTEDAERLFFDAIVRRVYEPGCKFDYMLVLQGPQGIGKSTFLRYCAIEDTFFTDDVGSFGTRDFAQRLQGKTVIEVAELAALRRADLEAVKRAITCASDQYRAPYARDVKDYPRRCVLAGTTNASVYLADQTGNRRFLPIVCGVCEPTRSLHDDEEAAREDFRQAIAEAMESYAGGTAREKLVLGIGAEGALAAQQAAQQEDSRIGEIEEWLDSTTCYRVCAKQICVEALGIEKPKQYEINEVREIMRREFKEKWPENPKRQKCDYGKHIVFERRGAS